MEELLSHLESEVRKLADHHDKLKGSNQELQRAKAFYAQEKTQLVAKNQRAIHQLESLIAKLKSIEKLI